MPWRWNQSSTPHRNDEAKRHHRTEKVAYALYHNRLLLDREGNSSQDWEKARQIAGSPYHSLLFSCHCRFITLEKRVWEPLLHWADSQAVLSLLGVIGNVGVILAVFSYISSEKLRRDAEIFGAWQTITSAYGQPGNGGRIKALEFLNASPGANWRRKFPWFCTPMPLCTWPKESLAGINLSASKGEINGAYLVKVQLPRADLLGANAQGAILNLANLEGATLNVANLEGATLNIANLKKANLIGANLERTLLFEANLEEANLAGANLDGAILNIANLERADLWKTNLERTDLSMANLEEAKLLFANLEGAKLFETNLKRAYLGGTSLSSVSGLTEAQLSGINRPYLCNTLLPDEFSEIDPFRDCEQLKFLLTTQYNYSSERAQREIKEVRQYQWVIKGEEAE